jgi:hypothetical protein
LTEYPNFAHYISDNALIVENELSKKAVMRIAHSLPLSDEQEALVASKGQDMIYGFYS